MSVGVEASFPPRVGNLVSFHIDGKELFARLGQLLVDAKTFWIALSFCGDSVELPFFAQSWMEFLRRVGERVEVRVLAWQPAGDNPLFQHVWCPTEDELRSLPEKVELLFVLSVFVLDHDSFSIVLNHVSFSLCIFCIIVDHF